MAAPQIGIFALGDAAQGYFELSCHDGVDARDVVAALADMREPRSTVGGVNLVVGIRPELWAAAGGALPPDARGFDEPVRGHNEYAMPATQSDLWLWIAGASYDIVFDVGRSALQHLSTVASLDREIAGWSYRHSRDLTGFEDGTENPSLYEAMGVALVPDDDPAAGGSIVLVQQWKHHARDWSALSVERQERVIGRTKAESIELDDAAMPDDSHVSRSKLVQDGAELHIFRRNVPYGIVSDHGTVFVGFAADQRRLSGMLERMAGAGDGIRDALTYYSTPLTGAYYFVPSLDALKAYSSRDDAG